MWRTVLLLALMTSTDPIRLAITALLVARPRPLLNLFAFWLGGMAAGIAAGIAVLFSLHDLLPAAVHSVTSTVASLTRGPVRITIGAFALLVAARIARKLYAQRAAPVPVPVPVPVMAPADQLAMVKLPIPAVFPRLLASVRDTLERGHPWVAFVVGLGSATPPVEYLIALAAILASGAAAGSQVCAVVMFTVVVLVIVEIPLVSFLATPTKTQAMMQSLHNWLRAQRSVISAFTIASAGVMLVASGMASV
jgi:hypothetical protein